MNSSILILFVIIFIIIIVLFIMISNNKNNKIDNFEIPVPIAPTPTVTIIDTPVSLPRPIEVVNDPVVQYDFNNSYNPLEEPVRRIDRYSMPSFELKRVTDIPSRGYPDTPSQFGVLVKKCKHKKDTSNNILRLFGKQQYPGSYKYEYYTMVNSGNDQIKIPIYHKRRNELYDGDLIFIKVLNAEYKVHLYEYDQPRYYPDLA